MTQQLAMDRVHPRRGFLAGVTEILGSASTRRPRESSTVRAPFDPKLNLTSPFALLTTGPR